MKRSIYCLASWCSGPISGVRIDQLILRQIFLARLEATFFRMKIPLPKRPHLFFLAKWQFFLSIKAAM
jgi:hypothetical protein